MSPDQKIKGSDGFYSPGPSVLVLSDIDYELLFNCKLFYYYLFQRAVS